MSPITLLISRFPTYQIAMESYMCINVNGGVEGKH